MLWWGIRGRCADGVGVCYRVALQSLTGNIRKWLVARGRDS